VLAQRKRSFGLGWLLPGPRERRGHGRLVRFAIAVVFSTVAAAASAASDEAARTRAAIDAFIRAAAALEHGDRATAAQFLDGMAASVSSLRDLTAQYVELAKKMEPRCQARSIEITDQIQSSNKREQEIQDYLGHTLQPKSDALDAQWQQLQKDLVRVSTERQPLVEEANYRNRCASEPGLWFEGGNRCWDLSFQDAFNNRYKHVNEHLADLQNQQQNLLQARGNLAQERARLENEAAQARNRMAELEAQRRHLEQLDRAARSAVTTLSNINLFWSQAQTIMQGRMSNTIDYYAISFLSSVAEPKHRSSTVLRSKRSFRYATRCLSSPKALTRARTFSPPLLRAGEV
jgi:hypothetical protein